MTILQEQVTTNGQAHKHEPETMSALTPDPDATVSPDDAEDHVYCCRKCQEPVDYGVERCPSCGYRGMGHRMLAKYRIMAYQMSVIGCYILILGIPLAKYPKQWRDAWTHRYEMGVAEVNDE